MMRWSFFPAGMGAYLSSVSFGRGVYKNWLFRHVAQWGCAYIKFPVVIPNTCTNFYLSILRNTGFDAPESD